MYEKALQSYKTLYIYQKIFINIFLLKNILLKCFTFHKINI